MQSCIYGGLIRQSIIASAMLGLMCLAPSASAALLVDNFESVGAPNPWPVTLNTLNSTNVNELGLAGVLGGVRSTTIQTTAIGIPGVDFTQVQIVAGAGLFDYSSTIETAANVSLLYDGGTGNLNADISSESAVQLDFLSFDFAGSIPLAIEIILNDGTNSASLTQNLTSAGAQSILFNFGSFTGINLVDLTSINSITVNIIAGMGADFRLDTISVVPGPASLALLGLASAFGRRRRRN